jgi:hypothetical protein
MSAHAKITLLFSLWLLSTLAYALVMAARNGELRDWWMQRGKFKREKE